MNKRKSLYLIVGSILITIMFFTYKFVITFDTSHYLWLTSLINTDFNLMYDWDVARGPVFPLFIKLCNFFAGINVNAILLGMYLMYVFMVLGCILIYKDIILKDDKYKKKSKFLIEIFSIIFILINPIIFGFYHTLLTEFFATTLAIWGCLLAWKLIDINFYENKIKYIVYTVIISILVVIAWQLKQPYVGTILFPFIISIILSIIQQANLKNILVRVISLFFCIILLIVSIKIWNITLVKLNVEINETRTSSGFFSERLIDGLSNYKEIKPNKVDTQEKIEENIKISFEDKEKIIKIINKDSEYKSYKIMDTKKENYEVIYLKNDNISTSEAVKFVFKKLFTDFKNVFSGYWKNYLATIGLYLVEFEGQDTIIKEKIEWVQTSEIGAIGFKIFKYGKTPIFPLAEQYEPYTYEYQEINKPIILINAIMNSIKNINVILMKIALLILPIITILGCIVEIWFRKKFNSEFKTILNLININFLFSLAHILVHVVLGSTIDRYSVPIIIPVYIGIICGICLIVNNKKYKYKMIEEKGKN